jgi:putative ATPase
MMESLFHIPKPLAERMRPKTLDEYVGQDHIMPFIKKICQSGSLPSMIFWGQPGVGKTTLANLLCISSGKHFSSLSAVSSGVKEVREVIESAVQRQKIGQGTVLFIDEIHRFNKSQQDALLAAVEKGTLTLLGATTENPSFEVNSALLSRCQVYSLRPLEKKHLKIILKNALKNDEWLKQKPYYIEDDQTLLKLSDGDARKALNLLETAISLLPENEFQINNQIVEQAAQRIVPLYDKNGEQHYDIISAFIKSLRGSDPNAAIYYLARMIEAGEDPKFIARRMLILASEDIGNANPTALVLANSCFQAVSTVGMPEARIILSQTAAYLASSPKSNAAYVAIESAIEAVKKTGNLKVPLHLRNSPTQLMKQMGYGKDYQYAHHFEGNFADMEFMPDEIKGLTLYNPSQQGREAELRVYLKKCWKDKYGY